MNNEKVAQLLRELADAIVEPMSPPENQVALNIDEPKQKSKKKADIKKRTEEAPNLRKELQVKLSEAAKVYGVPTIKKLVGSKKVADMSDEEIQEVQNKLKELD